jgi:hypothetical protein
LAVALGLDGVLAFLVPNVLIGVCEHPHMACRLATLPALNLLGLGVALFAALNALYLFKISRKDVSENA